jgi:hypothetical protein
MRFAAQLEEHGFDGQRCGASYVSALGDLPPAAIAERDGDMFTAVWTVASKGRTVQLNINMKNNQAYVDHVHVPLLRCVDLCLQPVRDTLVAALLDAAFA